MPFLIIAAILITAKFIHHGSKTNLDLWWVFDDLRWNAAFSLADDAEEAENTLNYLRYYRG